MSKIVLLHGFAVGLTAPIVRPPFGASASLEAFEKDVFTGRATVFPWGIERKVQPWELLNPFLFDKLYLEESNLVHSDKLQSELHHFFEEQQPSVIVAHSMGCLLLQLYLEKFTVPSSVKSIVLVQSDLPASVSLRTTIPIYHLYCPWDPTLLVSSTINKTMRAGLQPTKQPGVKDILFPLKQLPNLHTSSICDKKLVKFVDSLL